MFVHVYTHNCNLKKKVSLFRLFMLLVVLTECNLIVFMLDVVWALTVGELA